jgi:hypothetical protein
MAIYSTTEFAHLPIEDLVNKLCQDRFVLPADTWHPTYVYCDCEPDDDATLLLLLFLNSKMKRVTLRYLGLQLPKDDLLEKRSAFYSRLPGIDMIQVFADEDSKNGNKIDQKGYF